MDDAEPRPVAARTYFDNGSGIAWSVPHGVDVRFSGEGEWNITLDVFRDLGLPTPSGRAGDVDQDGDVDQADYNIWSTNAGFNTRYNATIRRKESFSRQIFSNSLTNSSLGAI